ncbi:hypothetical protein E4U53_002067, partial [Claviceps sorghi]
MPSHAKTQTPVTQEPCKMIRGIGPFPGHMTVRVSADTSPLADQTRVICSAFVLPRPMGRAQEGRLVNGIAAALVLAGVASLVPAKTGMPGDADAGWKDMPVFACPGEDG